MTDVKWTYCGDCIVICTNTESCMLSLHLKLTQCYMSITPQFKKKRLLIRGKKGFADLMGSSRPLY